MAINLIRVKSLIKLYTNILIKISQSQRKVKLMEETKSLICTRCGSQHLEKQSETEYKCLSCDAII